MQLRCLDEDGEPLKHASASGFVRMEDGAAFLSTCWHVVTGYDPNDLRVGYALPKRAFLEVFARGHRCQTERHPVVAPPWSCTLALYDESARPKRPRWYQDRAHLPHPDLNAIGLCVPSWHDAVKIPLPDDVSASGLQLVPDPVMTPNTPLTPGERICVVGFPHTSRTEDFGFSTPVVLSRLVTAATVSGRREELLLNCGGVPGMSGGPVFVERGSQIALLGVYTGIIYANPVIGGSGKVGALGSCANLSLCWRGSRPLVREPTAVLAGS